MTKEIKVAAQIRAVFDCPIPALESALIALIWLDSPGSLC
jgi:hypothetical protein